MLFFWYNIWKHSLDHLGNGAFTCLSTAPTSLYKSVLKYSLSNKMSLWDYWQIKNVLFPVCVSRNSELPLHRFTDLSRVQTERNRKFALMFYHLFFDLFDLFFDLFRFRSHFCAVWVALRAYSHWSESENVLGCLNYFLWSLFLVLWSFLLSRSLSVGVNGILKDKL